MLLFLSTAGGRGGRQERLEAAAERKEREKVVELGRSREVGS